MLSPILTNLSLTPASMSNVLSFEGLRGLVDSLPQLLVVVALLNQIQVQVLHSENELLFKMLNY